jgi:ParB/RepB/Spo0J family partition protein
MNAPEAQLHTNTVSVLLPVANITRSPSNPRKHFNEAALADLAESIKNLGVLQPILVRKWQVGMQMPHGKCFGDMTNIYEIVCGERRWRASQLAGAETILAIVRDLTDLQVLEIQVVENLQREDVHPIEEATGYERLMQHHGYTADTLAAKIGKSKAYVYARLKLTALAPACRDMFYEGKLTASTALLIARIPGTTLQVKAATEITEPDYRDDVPSYRRAVQIIQQNYTLDLDDATFKPDDAKLVPAAGACTHCPKRSGNDLFLFADISHANVCTDPTCFSNKREVNFIRLKTLAEKSGRKVITGKDAEPLVVTGNYSLRSNGYEPLDAKVEHDTQGRTVRELLGDNSSGIVSIEHARQHNMIEVVDSKTLAAAVKKAGIFPATKSGRFGDDDTDRDYAREREELDAKYASENVWRGKLFEAVRKEIAEGANRKWLIDDDDMRSLAVSTWQRETQWIGCDQLDPLLTLWGHPLPDDEYDEATIALEFSAHLRTLDAADLYLFLMDIALIEEVTASRYDVGQGMQPTRLLAQAKRLGIDAEALREKPAKVQSKTAKVKPSAAKKSADTPLPAAQAQDISAPEKTEAALADEPTAKPVKTAKSKAKVKGNPPAASPPNEPPLAAKPANGTTELQPKAAWPFPVGARI